MVQLLVTLRFYATGPFQVVVGDLVGIHQSSVSRILEEVSNALVMSRGDFIQFPCEAELETIQAKLCHLGNFPGVFGSIDCTHIPFKTVVVPKWGCSGTERDGFQSMCDQKYCRQVAWIYT